MALSLPSSGRYPETSWRSKYFLNRFRLAESVPLTEFSARTGLEQEAITQPLNQAQSSA